MKKLLSLFIVIIFLLSAIVMSPAINAVNVEEKDDLSMQYESTKQNNRIINYFRKNIFKLKSDVDAENIGLFYPDYYGGSYLNDDYELVILLKDSKDKVKENLAEIAENESLQFDDAEYSYAELCNYIDIITEYRSSYRNNNSECDSYDIAQDVVEWSLNDKKNCIEVGIKELNDEKIKLFKEKVLDSEALVFKNVDDLPDICSGETNNNDDVKLLSSVVVNAGIAITSSNTYNYSMGFPAHRTIGTTTKQYGFVTAGHNMNVGDTIRKYSDQITKLGTVKLTRFGKYDISFVAFSSGVSATNVINGTLFTLCPNNSEIDYPVYGKSVNKYAMNGTASGKIISTDTSYTPKSTPNVTITGVMETSCPSYGGDSGGIIVSSLSTSLSTKLQEGIISGGNSKHSFCTSAANVVNLWYLIYGVKS